MRITILGDGSAGKRTAIAAMREYGWVDGKITSWAWNERDVRFLDCKRRDMQFACASYFDDRTEVVEYLTRETDVVLYLFESPWREKWDVEGRLDSYYQDERAAARIGRGKSDTDWLLVLNKIDLSKDNPFLVRCQSERWLEISALHNLGLDNLLDFLESFKGKLDKNAHRIPIETAPSPSAWADYEKSF